MQERLQQSIIEKTITKEEIKKTNLEVNNEKKTFTIYKLKIFLFKHLIQI